MMGIEEVGQLGKTIIEQWAENTHQEEIARAKLEAPSLTNYGKKTPLVHHLRTGLDSRTGAEHGAAGRNLTGVQTAGEHRLPQLLVTAPEAHRRLLLREQRAGIGRRSTPSTR
jgi:hypothetical protein